jgi:hypothetical protein
MSVGSYGWTPSGGFNLLTLDFPFLTERVVITAERRELLVQSWNGIKRNRRVRIASEYIADPRRLVDAEKGLIDVVTAIEAVAGEDPKRRLQRRTCLYCARIVASDLGITQRQVYDGLMFAFTQREKVLRGTLLSADERAADRQILDLSLAVARRFIQLRVFDDERLKRPIADALLDDPH